MSARRSRDVHPGGACSYSEMRVIRLCVTLIASLAPVYNRHFNTVEISRSFLPLAMSTLLRMLMLADFGQGRVHRNGSGETSVEAFHGAD